MRTRQEVAQDLQQCARNVGDGSGLGRRLSSLGDALENSSSGHWTDVDLFTVLDPDTASAVEAAEPRPARSLDILRNVLLLLPVMITWFGIFSAVQAYRELLAVPAERVAAENTSFLELWTTGFGNRTSFTLDLVAILDAVAILGVVVVVIVSSRRGQRKREHDRRVAELHDLLSDATLLLAEERRGAPDRLTQELEQMERSYREAADSLRKAQSEISKSLTAGSKQVDEMTRTTAKLSDAGKAVVQSATTLRGRVDDVGTQVGRLESTVTSVVTSTGSLGARIPEIRESLGDVVDAVHEVQTQLTAAGTSQEKIVEQLGRFADNPHETAQAAQRTAELARQAEKALADAVEVLPKRLDTLRGAIVSAVTSELDQRTEAVGHLGTTGQAAQEAATTARDAVRDLVHGLGEVRSLAGDITAAAAAGLHDEVDGLTTEVGKLETQLASLVQGTQGLAAQVPVVGTGLTDVLAGIRGVDTRLGTITTQQESLVQELSHFADAPLAAANATQRTARIARETEEALGRAVEALPAKLDSLRAEIVREVTAELDQRKAAVAELGRVGDAARQAAEQARSAAEQSRTAASHITTGIARVQAMPADVAHALTGIRAALDESRAATGENRELSRHLYEQLMNARASSGRRWWWPGR